MTEIGIVNRNLEAVVSVRLRGLSNQEYWIDAIVDTSYTGSLTLPISVVQQMALKKLSGGRAILADGSIKRFETYIAEIFWAGMWTSIAVSTVGDESLLGMSLLQVAGFGSKRCRVEKLKSQSYEKAIS